MQRPDPYVPLHTPQLPQNAYDVPSLAPQPPQPPPGAPVYVPPSPVAMQPLPTPFVDTRARNAAVALIACGAALLVGMISHAWFSTRGGNVGLLGLEECRRSFCQSISWMDVPRAPSELKLFASLGLLGGLAALGFLIQAAVVLFKHQPHRVLTKWLNGSLGLAAFGCTSFLFHLSFGELSKNLSLSWAGFAAMGGIIAASIVVASMLRPLTRATNRA